MPYIFLFQYFELRFFSFILIQFKFVDPLLRSPIVGDVAYETLIKLSRCTAIPLCNWAIDVATALRLIATDEVQVQLDLIPSVNDGEENERPSLGLFERIVAGLSVSCKSGPLPVDSFTFVFPVSFFISCMTMFSSVMILFTKFSRSLFSSDNGADSVIL